MTSKGTFTEPPPFGAVGDYSDLPSYGINTTVKLEWTLPSDDNVTNLWLVQDNVEGTTCGPFNWANTACTLILTGNRGKSWDWPIQQPDGYLVSSPIYWLSMRDVNDDLDDLFGSHYFNLLPQNLLTSSSSPSSTILSAATTQKISTTSSNTTAASTSNVSTSSSPSSSQTDSSSSSGLSTKVAIGVGVGVGIPLIAVLVATMFFLRKNKKNKMMATAALADTDQVHHGSKKSPLITTSELHHNHANHGTYYDMQKPQEMSGSDGSQAPYFPPVELDAEHESSIRR